MLVTTNQIKAARSLIGWRQYDLAAASGLAISTVRRLECLDGPITAHYDTVERLVKAFDAAGVEFYGNPCPGVRLKPKFLHSNKAL